MLPIESMHGIFTYSSHGKTQNVGRDVIRGSCGLLCVPRSLGSIESKLVC